MVEEIIDSCLMCKKIKLATPSMNRPITVLHDRLTKRMALGYLFTEMKFLKSFKSFRSSVSDLESDRYSLLSFTYFIDFLCSCSF